jgi:hypothetical protein
MKHGLISRSARLPVFAGSVAAALFAGEIVPAAAQEVTPDTPGPAPIVVKGQPPEG